MANALTTSDPVLREAIASCRVRVTPAFSNIISGIVSLGSDVILPTKPESFLIILARLPIHLLRPL